MNASRPHDPSWLIHRQNRLLLGVFDIFDKWFANYRYANILWFWWIIILALEFVYFDRQTEENICRDNLLYIWQKWKMWCPWEEGAPFGRWCVHFLHRDSPITRMCTGYGWKITKSETYFHQYHFFHSTSPPVSTELVSSQLSFMRIKANWKPNQTKPNWKPIFISSISSTAHRSPLLKFQQN